MNQSPTFPSGTASIDSVGLDSDMNFVPLPSSDKLFHALPRPMDLLEFPSSLLYFVSMQLIVLYFLVMISVCNKTIFLSGSLKTEKEGKKEKKRKKIITIKVRILNNNIAVTNPVGGGRYCSLLLAPQHLRNTESSITPVAGRLTIGHGGGNLTLRPHIVVRFFISLPHLNLFLLFVNIASIDSLRI